jgi:hypothetical protein
MQWRAEGNLAQHAYQLELRGSLGAIAWPSVCASCGDTASGSVPVRKAFLRPRSHGRSSRSGGYRRTIIRAAEVPFCTACIAEHEATVKRPGLGTQLLRTLLTPLLIPVVGASIFGTMVLRGARDIDPRAPGAWIPWGLMALFAFIIAWCLFLAWEGGRAYRIEKQTEVTRSCDFSDDVSDLFGEERHIYSLRNQQFAESLATLNRDRVWTAEDDQQVTRRWGIVAGIAIVIGVITWIIVVLGPGP